MATGTLGNPDVEYFYPGAEPIWSRRWKTRDYRAYVQRVKEVSTTPNGIFGVKLMWGYFPDFVSKLAATSSSQPLSRTIPITPHHAPSLWRRLRRESPRVAEGSVHDLLESVFPNLRYIYVTRHDKVRQAVSHWKAIQTGQWTSRDVPAGASQPEFDVHEIDRLLRETLEHEAAWRAFFDETRVRPLTVTYEDLADDAHSVVRRVALHLGIEDIPTTRRSVGLRKQADAISEDWVRRYLENTSGVGVPPALP